MTFVNEWLDTEIYDYIGKFVVSLLYRTVSKE